MEARPAPALQQNAVERRKLDIHDGRLPCAEYWVGEELVAHRSWNDEGQLVQHISFRGSKRHGPCLSWHDNGALSHETAYVDGLEHGVARQYDWDGNLIGTYVMDHGTGADLWFSERGRLAEERYYVDGERHGFERWWDGDNVRVRDEQHYCHGVAHGVFRQWNSEGRLRRGYPQFFVEGVRVTKRQYLRAAVGDATLPPFRESENLPERDLPLGEMS